MNNTRVKKINAYPIDAALALAKGPATGKILKLTQIGFLIELASPFLQVGDKIEASFELPVTHKYIKENCLVIKIYNQHLGTLDHKVQHIAEIHFKPLTAESRTAITAFLNLLRASSGEP